MGTTLLPAGPWQALQGAAFFSPAAASPLAALAPAHKTSIVAEAAITQVFIAYRPFPFYLEGTAPRPTGTLLREKSRLYIRI
jgi:hypothetical protein